MILELLGGRTELSGLRDPFTVAGFDGMHIFVRRGVFNKSQIHFNAYVKFENGPTKGEHGIEASNFPELLQKIEAFLKAIPQ